MNSMYQRIVIEEWKKALPAYVTAIKEQHSRELRKFTARLKKMPISPNDKFTETMRFCAEFWTAKLDRQLKKDTHDIEGLYTKIYEDFMGDCALNL